MVNNKNFNGTVLWCPKRNDERSPHPSDSHNNPRSLWSFAPTPPSNRCPGSTTCGIFFKGSSEGDQVLSSHLRAAPSGMKATHLHFKSELHFSCFCWESPERFNWSGKSTCISQLSMQVILIKVGSLSMIQGLESILSVLCGTHRPSLDEVICKKRTL